LVVSSCSRDVRSCLKDPMPGLMYDGMRVRETVMNSSSPCMHCYLPPQLPSITDLLGSMRQQPRPAAGASGILNVELSWSSLRFVELYVQACYCYPNLPLLNDNMTSKRPGQALQAEVALLHSLKNCLVNLPAPLVAVLVNANTVCNRTPTTLISQRH